ncbi:neural proliferation differentiation and control protein 1 isoform X2 [Ochotona curzoniae]|uniref:neural proliferation differentiation and control protein 1 isoform X2 n=1 Tax=Ochotona curzoniae TaxID=130825 RepID=UPI001B34DF2B|nr:neural proliferation differentiation and control protein 1 isoform X2 [Ochotona curzoniae]
MATPVPPPSSRHLRLLRLLLSGLVLGAALRGASAAAADAATCPRSLDCTLKRRARCPPGAHACGPCLQPFHEDSQGRCVSRAHRPPGEGPLPPRLEDEIDLLAQELARKEAGPPRASGGPLSEALERLLKCSFPAATPGFSELAPGPRPGLPVTPAAPTPASHSSLGPPASSGPVQVSRLEHPGQRGDALALVLVVGFCVAGVAALAMAALCWCRLQRDMRLAQKVDYAATKAPGSPATPRISPGDQRLAHCAELFHFQRQRQQMLSLERHKEPAKELDSASSDEENEDCDFTVYECPGLAPTGEMEVRNPLFDPTSPPVPQ